MTPVQVRCERRLWRMCSAAGSGRPPRTANAPPRKPLDATASLVWAGLYAVAGTVLIGLAVAFGWLFLLGAAVALALAVGLGYAYVVGSMWWMAGAGEPVLDVHDGVVRGRIRPLAKGDRAGPTVPGWWDFELPAAQVTAVKLTGREGRPARRCLVLDLPAETSLTLVDRAETGWYAKRWLGYAGGPAAWPVGRMLRRRGRGARLAELQAALQLATGRTA